MSDTPLTDENLWVGIHGCFKTSKTDGKGYIPESLSRELERELNAAKARIARLEEAGDAMCEDYEMVAMDRIELKRIADWRAAKESKP